MRIHRSFIVTFNKITEFTHEFVEINNKELHIWKFSLDHFFN
ncbi:hypothetical protein ACGK9U_11225 [Mariniflexile sp. HNIBRBA6329]